MAHHGQHTRQLFVQRHGWRAGAGGFTAYIQDVGTLFNQLRTALKNS